MERQKMKSTLATILGVSALGLLKKRTGSSIKLIERTDFEYQLFFFPLNVKDKNDYLRERFMDSFEVLKNKLPNIRVVNEIFNLINEPFVITSPCTKYIAEFSSNFYFKGPGYHPTDIEYIEKLRLISSVSEWFGVTFHKENYEPIEEEYFEEELFFVANSIIYQKLNKISSLLLETLNQLDKEDKEEYSLDCEDVRLEWKIDRYWDIEYAKEDEILLKDVYRSFLNQNEYDSMQMFYENSDIPGGEEFLYGLDVKRTRRIYNVDTGKIYKAPEQTNSKLRKR